MRSLWGSGEEQMGMPLRNSHFGVGGQGFEPEDGGFTGLLLRSLI